MEEYKVINARVYCTGVKSRCRKTELHKFKVGDFPILEFDESKVISMAVDTVKKKMKRLLPGRPIELGLSEDKIVERDGMQIRSFLIGKGYRTVDITEHFQ